MSLMDIFDTANDAAWDFVGNASYTDTLADNSPWRAKFSAGGTATVGNVGGGVGELTLAMTATNEAQNCSLYQGDLLQFDIDDLLRVEFRIKMGQATLTSGNTFSFGMISARADAHTSATALVAFSIVGATSTTEVYVETDDNVTDTAPVATGKTLVAAYKTFAIDFSNGKSDVRFYIDGQPVCLSTTFTMAGYTAGLQPYVQIQKTSSTNTGTAVVDYVRVICRRPV